MKYVAGTAVLVFPADFFCKTSTLVCEVRLDEEICKKAPYTTLQKYRLTNSIQNIIILAFDWKWLYYLASKVIQFLVVFKVSFGGYVVLHVL